MNHKEPNFIRFLSEHPLSLSRVSFITLSSFCLFLDASSHLYKRVCPSVGPSVRPSVRPSVGRSVRPRVTLSSKTGKSMILIANNDVSCNHIITQSFHQHEDALLALWALFLEMFENIDAFEAG